MNMHYVLILSLLLSGVPMIDAHKNQQNPHCSDCPDRDKPQKRSVSIDCNVTPEEPACGVANVEPVAQAVEAKDDQPKCNCASGAGASSGKPIAKGDQAAEQGVKDEQAKCTCSAGKPVPKPLKDSNQDASAKPSEEEVKPAVAAVIEKCNVCPVSQDEMTPRCGGGDCSCDKEPRDQK